MKNQQCVGFFDILKLPLVAVLCIIRHIGATLIYLVVLVTVGVQHVFLGIVSKRITQCVPKSCLICRNKRGYELQRCFVYTDTKITQKHTVNNYVVLLFHMGNRLLAIIQSVMCLIFVDPVRTILAQVTRVFRSVAVREAFRRNRHFSNHCTSEMSRASRSSFNAREYQRKIESELKFLMPQEIIKPMKADEDLLFEEHEKCDELLYEDDFDFLWENTSINLCDDLICDVGFSENPKEWLHKDSELTRIFDSQVKPSELKLTQEMSAVDEMVEEFDRNPVLIFPFGEDPDNSTTQKRSISGLQTDSQRQESMSLFMIDNSDFPTVPAFPEHTLPENVLEEMRGAEITLREPFF